MGSDCLLRGAMQGSYRLASVEMLGNYVHLGQSSWDSGDLGDIVQALQLVYYGTDLL